MLMGTEKLADGGLIRALLRKTAAGLQLDIRLMRALRVNTGNKLEAIKPKQKPGRSGSAELTDNYLRLRHYESPETHYAVIKHC